MWIKFGTQIIIICFNLFNKKHKINILVNHNYESLNYNILIEDLIDENELISKMKMVKYFMKNHCYFKIQVLNN